MSYCVSSTRHSDSAVNAPTISTTDLAVALNSYKGDIRPTMKMPAVTIVAAWISAEMGVGPSIESGSQTCSGNCADLPIAPMKSRMQITVMSDQAAPGTISIVLAASFGAPLKTAP